MFPNIILFLVDDMGLMDTSAPMLTDEDGNPQRHSLYNLAQDPSESDNLAANHPEELKRMMQGMVQELESPTTGQTARSRSTPRK